MYSRATLRNGGVKISMRDTDLNSVILTNPVGLWIDGCWVYYVSCLDKINELHHRKNAQLCSGML